MANLQVKGKLAVLDILELVLVQVRPSPDPRVDDMGEALPGGHLGCHGLSPGGLYLVCTCSLPSRVRGIVTHFVGCAPLGEKWSVTYKPRKSYQLRTLW